MLRVFNNTARYVDQAGKRLGSIAVYLETWHSDIEAFLELKKNHFEFIIRTIVISLILTFMFTGEAEFIYFQF